MIDRQDAVLETSANDRYCTELFESCTARFVQQFKLAVKRSKTRMEVRFLIQNPEMTEEVAQALEYPTGTFIDPYGTSTDIVGVSEGNHDLAKDLLGNTGVHTWTDFPVSTSPRMTEEELGRVAMHYGGGPSDSFDTMAMSAEVCVSKCHVVVTEGVQFEQFSYDAVHQPRTETAREEDGLPVSPRSRPLPHQMSHAEKAAASAQSVPLGDE